MPAAFRAAGGTTGDKSLFSSLFKKKEDEMRGGLLWLIGVPIPVIILLYVFHVI